MNSKSPRFRASYDFNLADARAFQRICRNLQARHGAVPPALIEAAGDYVNAGSRLAQMQIVLTAVTRRAQGPAAESARVLQINRQIDATTSLRLRLADRLGLLDEVPV